MFVMSLHSMMASGDDIIALAGADWLGGGQVVPPPAGVADSIVHLTHLWKQTDEGTCLSVCLPPSSTPGLYLWFHGGHRGRCSPALRLRQLREHVRPEERASGGRAAQRPGPHRQEVSVGDGGGARGDGWLTPCPPLPRFVFFLDPCNVDLVQRRIRSLALCVSRCPAEELRTYQDLQRFGMVNGRSHDASHDLPLDPSADRLRPRPPAHPPGHRQALSGAVMSPLTPGS